MHRFNLETGSLGESLAENYLKNNGYIILEKNFRCKTGEIDLIGKDDEYISFIEVKTRHGNLYGYPSEAVTKGKQYKIYKTAQMYILKKQLFNYDFRFDVVEVILSHENNTCSIKLIKDAFTI